MCPMNWKGHLTITLVNIALHAWCRQQGVDPRALPNFLSMPNQSGISPPYMSFQNQSSVPAPYIRNSSYGASGPNIEGNPPQFPLHHSSLGMPGGSSANTDSFYPNVSQQQRLISQHSAGSFGSMFGTDPLFPSQPHNLHGSFSNKMGTDAPLPQGSFHFNTENPTGNPFGWSFSGIIFMLLNAKDQMRKLQRCDLWFVTGLWNLQF
mgnify:CR=1 FL=1